MSNTISSTKSLDDKVAVILGRFHRPHIDAADVVRILRKEGVSPGSLNQVQLEEEVRWAVMFRIEAQSDCVPSWREDQEEDDFFE